jgi:hypothetical protein
MSDLVEIAIPANAHAAAEALGLKVSRSVVSGVRIRQIEREDAELAIEFLRDWGFAAVSWRKRLTARARLRPSNGRLRTCPAPPSRFRIKRNLEELLAGDVVERLGHDPALRIDLADAVILHAGAWRQVLLHARRR